MGVRVRVGFKDNVQKGQNSIAFGSAPRREADSQPISQLVKQAVSQIISRASRWADKNTHKNTQFRFFFNGRLGFLHWGAYNQPEQVTVEW